MPSFTTASGRIASMIAAACAVVAAQPTAVLAQAYPRLVEEATVPGIIADVAPDRILYGTDTALVIRDRLTGVDSTPFGSVAAGYGQYVNSSWGGRLAPHGATFWNQGIEPQEWNGGAPIPLGYGAVTRGSYAIWGGGRAPLFRRDLAAEVTTLIPGTAGGDVGSDSVVAENGDVLYTTYSANQLIRWRGGVSTVLAEDAKGPITDGVNVLYIRRSQNALVEVTPSGEIVIAQGTADRKIDYYQITNGWIVYETVSSVPDGVPPQITERAPDGTTWVVPWTVALDVMLGPTGDLASKLIVGHSYPHGNSTYIQLFLTRFGDGDIPVGPVGSAGPPAEYLPDQAFWYDGGWHIAAGGTLYQVIPNWPGPLSYDQTVVAARDTPVAVPLAADNPLRRTVSYSLVATPAHGALSGAAPNLTYSPAAGFEGDDAFTFKANDGRADGNTATVTVHVITPLITVGSATVLEGRTVTLPISLSASVPSLAGLDLTLHAAGYPDPDWRPGPPTFNLGAQTFGWHTVRDPNNPWHITIANATGIAGPAELLRLTVVVPAGVGSPLVYTLGALTAKMTDEQGNDKSIASAVLPGRLTVADSPPATVDTSAMTFPGVPVGLHLIGIDPDGDPITFSIVAPPAHGTIGGWPEGGLPWYTPDAGFNGTDSFTFKANDGMLDGAISTATITVDPRQVLIGSGSVGAGEATTLPITIPAGVDGVTRIELSLNAYQNLSLSADGTNGAPSLIPAWDTGAQTAGWRVTIDPTNPWYFAVSNETGISGPAEVMTLSLQSPPSTPIGAVYTVAAATYPASAAIARLTGARGTVNDTRMVVPGTVTVTKCQTREKGDIDASGTVDLGDAILALRLAVLPGEPANACRLAAADLNCDGSVSLGDVIHLLQFVTLGTPLPACQ